MKYIWKRHIKWRIEESQAVICNCLTTEYFDVPIDYLDTCESLDRGISDVQLPEALRDDFTALSLLDILEEEQ